MSILSELIQRVWNDRRVSPSGSDCQVQMAKMRARLIARYRLVEVPGRPEELEHTQTGKRVSLGLASKSVRVRAQQGRMWLAWIDVQVYGEGEGWQDRTLAFLDEHFGYIKPRPIRDNPQA